MYLACPSAPFDVEGGWAEQAEGFDDALVEQVSGHTVPGIAGLFTCGASTAPVGGIAGSSGKAAALALLKAKARPAARFRRSSRAVGPRRAEWSFWTCAHGPSGA